MLYAIWFVVVFEKVYYCVTMQLSRKRSSETTSLHD